MIRLCSTINGVKLASFTLGENGIENKCIHDSCARGARVASNMGEPCWFSVYEICDALYLRAWESNDICGKISFTGRSYSRITHASVVHGLPLMIVGDPVNAIVTSSGVVKIDDGICYIGEHNAIVERNGDRLYVQSCTDDKSLKPIGESVPFGWWLPYDTMIGTVNYAAFGDIIGCATLAYDNMPVWDCRVGMVANIPKLPRIYKAHYSRCTFMTEHLLTVCYDTIFDGVDILDTMVVDLRNMDTYDVGSAMDSKLTLFCTHAFCALTTNIG